jgi:putative ABC transport system permease protein
MMNRMIVANLVHRPVRSLISIIAIALEVTLILLIVGLSLGIRCDAVLHCWHTGNHLWHRHE